MLSRRLIGVYNPIAMWHLRWLRQQLALGFRLDSGHAQNRHSLRLSASGAGTGVLAFLNDSLVGRFNAPLGIGASAPVFDGPDGRKRVRSHTRRLYPPLWRRP